MNFVGKKDEDEQPRYIEKGESSGELK